MLVNVIFNVTKETSMSYPNSYSPSNKPRKRTKSKASMGCVCGALILVEHIGDHIRKGNHSEKVRKYRKHLEDIRAKCKKTRNNIHPDKA